MPCIGFGQGFIPFWLFVGCGRGRFGESLEAVDRFLHEGRIGLNGIGGERGLLDGQIIGEGFAEDDPGGAGIGMIGGVEIFAARQLPQHIGGMLAAGGQIVEHLQACIHTTFGELIQRACVGQTGGDAVGFFSGRKAVVFEREIVLPAEAGDREEDAFIGGRRVGEHFAGGFDCRRLVGLGGKQFEADEEGALFTGQLFLNAVDELEKLGGLGRIAGFDIGGPGAGHADDEAGVGGVALQGVAGDPKGLIVAAFIEQAFDETAGGKTPSGGPRRRILEILNRLIAMAQTAVGLGQEIPEIGVCGFDC